MFSTSYSSLTVPMYRSVTPITDAPRHSRLPHGRHRGRAAPATMAAPNPGHRSLLLLLLCATSACRTLALTVMSDYEDGFATFYGALEQPEGHRK